MIHALAKQSLGELAADRGRRAVRHLGEAAAHLLQFKGRIGLPQPIAGAFLEIAQQELDDRAVLLKPYGADRAFVHAAVEVENTEAGEEYEGCKVNASEQFRAFGRK